MNLLFRCCLCVFLLLILLSSCKKKATTYIKKDSDTIAITKKMLGQHAWHGTFTSSKRIDASHFADSFSNVSFNCPIERFGMDSIFFDSGTLNTKVMGRIIFDTSVRVIQFHKACFYDKYTSETGDLAYKYLTDTIYYYGYYQSRNYSSELKIHSP